MKKKRIRSIGGIKRATRPIKNKIHINKIHSESIINTPKLSSQNKKSTSKRLVYKNKKSGNHTVSFSLSLFMKKNWFWLRHIWAVIFVVGGLFWYFDLHEKTIIELRPHHEFVEINESLELFKYPQEDQIAYNVIAISGELEIPIEAQGVRDVYTKSQGIITIFNDYSTEPQRLLPNTRFQSAGGKVFLLGDDEIIVPGKKNTTPGSINAFVYAEESGPEYNIDITDFVILGFKEAGLAEKYNGMYAVSQQKMSGGKRGTEKYITDSQREIAEKELQDKLTQRLQNRLVVEKTEKLMLIQGSQIIQFQELEYKNDTIHNLEVIKGKALLLSLGISKENITKYLESILQEDQVNYDLRIHHLNNLYLSVNEVEGIDVNNLTSINTTIKGTLLIQAIVDTDKLQQKLVNYPKDKIVEYMDSKLNIDMAHVYIRPFWKKNMSPEISNINIVVNK